MKAYIIPEDTKINKDGALIELGQEISIQGTFPQIHINGHYDGFDFDFDIAITSHVSWFIKTPIYDHFSLLAKFKGFLNYQAERIESQGLCTYEYARAVGPHSITNKLIPDVYKLPLDFFYISNHQYKRNHPTSSYQSRHCRTNSCIYPAY